MHETISKKFSNAGYEMPTIIYWNLRASIGVPIGEADKEGVALLSGYSAGLMRSMLAFEPEEEVEVVDETGKVRKERPKMTPYTTMLNALKGELYEQLSVAPIDR